jgi:glycosyltransferase involved in cell wall biosynthesis
VNDNRPLTIFQILEFNQFNTGSVHQMFQAAVGLRERGHDVTVISRAGDVLSRRAEDEGIAFAAFPFAGQADLRTIRGIAALVANRKPDVIHVHKGLAHSLSMAATWLHPVRAFVVNRGVSFPLDVWNRIKYRTARVDRVVTVCDEIRRVIIESGRLPPAKVEVIYAGTDLALFDPALWPRDSFRREKKIDDDRFLIAHVGVRDWKGWQELIDSVAVVASEMSAVHLALVGCRSQSEAEDVLSYARRAGVGAHVTAVEYRADMPSVLAACDLVVDASWAGTGITGTIREGMAMGKPVIATDCGGNGELVSSPEVGFLIPMKDRTALTAAIRRVIGDPVASARIGKNARSHVRDHFSKELRITRLEELYRRILAGNPARRADR